MEAEQQKGWMLDEPKNEKIPMDKDAKTATVLCFTSIK